MTPVVYLDAESRSRAPLKAVGGRVYAQDHSTSLLCWVALIDWGERLTVCAWGPWDCDPGWIASPEELAPLGFKPGDLEYEDWSREIPSAVRDCVRQGATFVAHNARGFDTHIWRSVCGYPEVEWRDSLELARRAALPGKLDEIGKTLFGMGKHASGQQTLKRLMEPNKRTGDFLTPDAAQMENVVHYCLLDVLLMAAVCDEENLLAPHVDDPVLEAHGAIDARGVKIDVELAEVLYHAQVTLREECTREVMAALGLSEKSALQLLRSPKALPRWLASQGVDVPDATAASIAPLAERDDVVGMVCRHRLDVATVTEGKALAALQRTETDGRMRGTMDYYGAHTGRWSGRGLQPQNLPRPPKGWRPEHVERIRARGLSEARRIAGEIGARVGECLAACLRGLLWGTFAQVDLDQIEARVLSWLAGEEEQLEEFRQGVDPYQAMADRLGVTRTEAKVVCLACGYQGSVGALEQWATTYGLSMDLDAKQRLVEGFRDARPALAGQRTGGRKAEDIEQGRRVFIYRQGGLWKRYEHAARSAIAGEPKAVGPVRFEMRGPDLHAVLPSGRTIRYRNAAIETVEDKWGEGQHGEAIRYDGVKYAKTVRQETYGGSLVENATQAVARDLIAHAIVALEEQGCHTVASVHDELLVENATAEQVHAALCRRPSWAPYLPLGAEGGIVERYAK